MSDRHFVRSENIPSGHFLDATWMEVTHGCDKISLEELSQGGLGPPTPELALRSRRQTSRQANLEVDFVSFVDIFGT